MANVDIMLTTARVKGPDKMFVRASGEHLVDAAKAMRERKLWPALYLLQRDGTVIGVPTNLIEDARRVLEATTQAEAHVQQAPAMRAAVVTMAEALMNRSDMGQGLHPETLAEVCVRALWKEMGWED